MATDESCPPLLPSSLHCSVLLCKPFWSGSIRSDLASGFRARRASCSSLETASDGTQLAASTKSTAGGDRVEEGTGREELERTFLQQQWLSKLAAVSSSRTRELLGEGLLEGVRSERLVHSLQTLRTSLWCCRKLFCSTPANPAPSLRVGPRHRSFHLARHFPPPKRLDAASRRATAPCLMLGAPRTVGSSPGSCNPAPSRGASD